MTARPRRTRRPTAPGRPADLPDAALRGAAAVALLCALPAAAAAQAPAGGGASLGLEAGAGVTLPAGGLADVADPGFSAGLGTSVLLGPNVAIRADGDLHLPARDVAAGPLIDVYSVTAGLEYMARQQGPGRLPLRTALSLGAGIAVVEAAEMPAAAPSGSTFSESYPTLSAGARLGYVVTSGVVVHVAPGVRWFDLPEQDWNRLTQGLGAAPPEHGWMVPLMAGVRISF